MDITVTIGPVPMHAARSWLAAADETMSILRDGTEVDIPWDVMDAFERYLGAWKDEAAGGNEVFLWSARVDEQTVTRIGLHWARIANISRSGRVASIATAPPEAAPFYEAIAIGIAEGLAGGSTTRVMSDAFAEVVPTFDTPVRGDTPEAPIRVLVVDDNDDLRLLLRVLLEGDGDFELVGEATTGHAAIEIAKRMKPDVAIFDLGLSERALESMSVVRSCSPATAVIAYSATTCRQAALAAGAASFLPKSTAIAEVVEAARSLGRDRSCMADDLERPTAGSTIR